MIFNDFGKALSQIGDPSFRGVVFKGVGLTLVMFIVIYAVVIWFLNWILPDPVVLPLIGEVGWLDEVLAGASLIVMVIASAFLMIPVASAVSSMFLDDVADAVEGQHYPHLSQAPRASFMESLRDSLKFLGVLVVANLFALILYVIFSFAAPLIFLALNGFLLGREYFQLVALRRLGREGAKRARSKHALTIWAAGTLMAVPLTIPILNLIIPVLGAATFTHLFHRLVPADGR
ncbi:MAG: EI24 domain-containing protein [Pseudomonadota bacterium]